MRAAGAKITRPALGAVRLSVNVAARQECPPTLSIDFCIRAQLELCVANGAVTRVPGALSGNRKIAAPAPQGKGDAAPLCSCFNAMARLVSRIGKPPRNRCNSVREAAIIAARYSLQCSSRSGPEAAGPTRSGEKPVSGKPISESVSSRSWIVRS